MRLALPLVCIAFSLPAFGQVTELLSQSSGGIRSNGYSTQLAITPDGRFVAFVSAATNLVAGDTNGANDVFVRDRFAGTTERVSLANGGNESDASSSSPAISADGRYVVFASSATNLVAGDTNDALDVFVRDRVLGTTTRVSVSGSGAQGDATSSLPSISADGRYVVFQSFASNLVSGDTGGFQDIFLRDLVAGTTERVDVSASGAQADQGATNPRISADGGAIVFDSGSTNLVLGDTNGQQDVFLRDRASGTIERVSLAGSATEANAHSSQPAVSGDGRYVAFVSLASNLVAGDTNGMPDIYVRDRVALTTVRASLGSNGEQPNAFCTGAELSLDGRRVAFESNATSLIVPDMTSYLNDVFVRDLDAGTLEFASLRTNGAQPDDASTAGVLSADGRFVAFLSFGTDVVPGDTNGAPDVFLRDRRASGFTSLCAAGSGGVIACPCANPPAGAARGCDNSTASGGAALAASGAAHLAQDTLVFATSGETPSATSVVMQGDALVNSGLVFGQGVRCAGGTLKRLYVKTASSGAIQAPDLAGGDSSVHARSAALGDPLAPGAVRGYFVYYRDPLVLGGCPAGSTFNATQTGRVEWQP